MSSRYYNYSVVDDDNTELLPAAQPQQEPLCAQDIADPEAILASLTLPPLPPEAGQMHIKKMDRCCNVFFLPIILGILPLVLTVVSTICSTTWWPLFLLVWCLPAFAIWVAHIAMFIYTYNRFPLFHSHFKPSYEAMFKTRPTQQEPPPCQQQEEEKKMDRATALWWQSICKRFYLVSLIVFIPVPIALVILRLVLGPEFASASDDDDAGPQIAFIAVAFCALCCYAMILLPTFYIRRIANLYVVVLDWDIVLSAFLTKVERALEAVDNQKIGNSGGQHAEQQSQHICFKSQMPAILSTMLISSIAASGMTVLGAIRVCNSPEFNEFLDLQESYMCEVNKMLLELK